MFKRVLLTSFFLIGALIVTFALSPETTSAEEMTACGSLVQNGDVPSLGEKTMIFDCEVEDYVYVGICDVGGDRPDDLFQVRYSDGYIASENGVDPNGRETVDVNLIYLRSGKNTVTVNSVSDSGFAPYYLVMGGSAAEVGYRLLNNCGYDYVGEGFDYNSSNPDSCAVDIQVFMEDAAPSAGKIIVTYQYGTLNRPEGIMRASTIAADSERIDWKVNVPAPKWLRVWWQPANQTSWYLLPSQYWQGDGTSESEYGVWCADDDQLPSYHTAFDRAIPASDVPLYTPTQ